ncbi:MAG: caspase family protein, partial [bacterium]|nr:caspase family protein [bacterium]
MSLHAYFIGVNKHQDEEIRELKGAVRDALALYSIFKDTLPDEDIEYFVDEQATKEAILSTLNNIQEKAVADDTVILFFSGHGTNDHQIVPYDTSLKKQGETTISMNELASLFKSCAAEKIIIILDCCFSGGLSAKVIEDSPTSKSPHSPLFDLAGNGRVILTASSQEQEAYEHPNVRHGLLTKVLLTLLIEQLEPWSVMSLGDELISLVRAEAVRYGLDQTPKLFGEIKGGFT